MHNLMKLEFRKTKTGAYLRAVVIIGIITLAMLYLLASIPNLEPTEANLALSSYRFLAVMACLIEMCAFSILGAVIYSKLIIEEYAGKRVYLIFSYPIDRKKLFFTKVKIALLYSSVAMFISNFIIFGIFFGTDNFLHIVHDSLSLSVILQTAALSAIFSVLAGVVSLAAARIGFARKSTQITLVSAFIICCALCQASLLFVSSNLLLIILFALAVIIGIILFAEFSSKIARMEETI